MEDINKKAHEDELNKAYEEIGQAPRGFIGVKNKKDELMKSLEAEKLRRKRLSSLASSAVTEEEREMYYNAIIDSESMISILEEDLRMCE